MTTPLGPCPIGVTVPWRRVQLPQAGQAPTTGSPQRLRGLAISRAPTTIRPATTKAMMPTTSSPLVTVPRGRNGIVRRNARTRKISTQPMAAKTTAEPSARSRLRPDRRFLRSRRAASISRLSSVAIPLPPPPCARAAPSGDHGHKTKHPSCAQPLASGCPSRASACEPPSQVGRARPARPATRPARSRGRAHSADNLGLALLSGASWLGTIAEVGTRILIVDDDASFLGLVAELLAERGFDILGQAMDAGEALAAALRECPDGILLDINLPGRGGFATATALSQACPSARIVLTSAEVRNVAAEILRGCSAYAFVPKEELATTDLEDLFRRAGT